MNAAALRRAALGALAVSALVLCTPAVSQDTWSEKAPMPTPRLVLSAASLGGLVYAVGGTPGGCNDLATVEAYDPSTNSWAAKAPMPTARSHLATAVVGSVLYAIGGTNFCGTDYAIVEAYDPATNTWSPRAPMPAPRRAMRATVVDGRIYVIGGALGGAGFANTYRYDPSTDAWTTLPSAPSTRGIYAAGALDGVIYVMGGITGAGELTIDALDTASNTWSVHPQSFGPRAYVDGEVIGDLFYVAGGSGGETRLQAFDGTSFAEKAAIPAGVNQHATAETGGILYVIGGDAGAGPSARLFAYTPAPSNAAPVADAGDDQSVFAGSSCTADVQLDGTGSSDADGDTLAYSWTGAFGTRTGATPTVILPTGTHSITLTVDDGNGGVDSDDVAVVVADNGGPSVVALGASPGILWPPNHRMVSVSIVAAAADNCGAASCRIVSVTSNEPDNGTGDGNTGADWAITGDLTVDLRAERSGMGGGRIYTVGLECTDALGNVTPASVTVSVPRSQGD